MIVKQHRQYPHITVASDADAPPFSDCYGIVMECENCGGHDSCMIFPDKNEPKEVTERWRDAFVDKHRDCKKA